MASISARRSTVVDVTSVVVVLEVGASVVDAVVVVAGAGVVLSFIISIFPPWGAWLTWFSALSLAVNLLAVALGVWIAVTRVR